MKDRINERNGKNMSGLLENVQPAVKKETKRVVMITGAGLILMWILFAILHFTMPDKVPFDYTVILGGIGGGVIAVLNFFLMGLTVQKVVAMEDDKQAAMKMKASYTQRMMVQIIWGILAIAVPCFQFVAGLLPLLFPNIVIKAVGILGKKQAV